MYHKAGNQNSGFKEEKVLIKGLSQNNLTFFALGFGLDLVGPIEQNRSNSRAILRIL